MNSVYLDYAATAPLLPAAATAMQAGQALIGNPSSSHTAGQDAAEALQDARAVIARFLGVAPAEVVLTSGGSESDALALWGTFAERGFGGHLVTTAIEHSAVLESARALARLGVGLTVVDPMPCGHVAASDVAAALRPDTALVSVMHANNETGALQPVEEIIAAARQRGIPVHVDAVHSAGKVDLAGLRALGATLISVSAHKFGGPRGIGALAVGDGHRLDPMIRGGSQENGRRAGTGNVAGAMGMAAAAEVCLNRMTASYRDDVRSMRERLLDGLSGLGGVHLTAPGPAIEETVNLRFEGIRGDALADALDMQGVYVSTGSACHAGQDAVSHVLAAQGLSEGQARSAVRFSLGPGLSPADIDRAVAVTAPTVERLRRTAGRVGVAR